MATAQSNGHTNGQGFALPIDSASFAQDDSDVVVVIGSGAGGGTLAGELCAQGIRTVVLEAGPHLTGPDYENDETATLSISVGPPPTHKIWATQSGFTFPVLSDFWPHGAVAQSYGVFNDDTGFANRGTFVLDRSGVIRFAEMKQPGEPRDQTLWTAALKALQPG